MIRAKKVRFLSYTNSSFLDANRLRMGFGAFDPTRPLPRSLVSLPVIVILGVLFSASNLATNSRYENGYFWRYECCAFKVSFIYGI